MGSLRLHEVPTPHQKAASMTTGIMNCRSWIDERAGLSLLLIGLAWPQFPAAPIPINILQLGDSFSAGNGARSKLGLPNYNGPTGCHRSPTVWGQLYADLLSATGKYLVNYTNRACSGAFVENIAEFPEETFFLRNPPCPRKPSPFPEEYFNQTAPTKCSFWVLPQIGAVDESVDLILMTIGANDLRFDNIITGCLLPATWSAEDCLATIQSSTSNLLVITEHIVATLLLLHRRLQPSATSTRSKKIVLVTYPHLILQNVNYTVPSTTGGEPLSPTTMIRALADQANDALHTAVQQANERAGLEFVVVFNQTRALFAGHEPDPRPGYRNPNRWLHEFEASLLTLLDAYHPNNNGHTNLAKAVFAEGTFGTVS